MAMTAIRVTAADGVVATVVAIARAFAVASWRDRDPTEVVGRRRDLIADRSRVRPH